MLAIQGRARTVVNVSRLKAKVPVRPRTHVAAAQIGTVKIATCLRSLPIHQFPVSWRARASSGKVLLGKCHSIPHLINALNSIAILMLTLTLGSPAHRIY